MSFHMMVWGFQDNAALAMIEHSTLGNAINSRTWSCEPPTSRCKLWPCQKIIYILTLVHSYYKSLTFYLQEQPTLLTDLLTVLIPRIDHSRVVCTFRQIGLIPLIHSYLIAVQLASYITFAAHYRINMAFRSSTSKPLTMLITTSSMKQRTTRLFVTRSIASTASTISTLRNASNVTNCYSDERLHICIRWQIMVYWVLAV